MDWALDRLTHHYFRLSRVGYAPVFSECTPFPLRSSHDISAPHSATRKGVGKIHSSAPLQRINCVLDSTRIFDSPFSGASAGLGKNHDLLGKRRSRSIHGSWCLLWSRSLSKPCPWSRPFQNWSHFEMNFGPLPSADLDLFTLELILILLLIYLASR